MKAAKSLPSQRHIHYTVDTSDEYAHTHPKGEELHLHENEIPLWKQYVPNKESNKV